MQLRLLQFKITIDIFSQFRMPLDTRLELEKLESERKTIINSLAKLESQIYDFEGSYLKETGAYGNAVKVTNVSRSASNLE